MLPEYKGLINRFRRAWPESGDVTIDLADLADLVSAVERLSGIVSDLCEDSVAVREVVRLHHVLEGIRQHALDLDEHGERYGGQDLARHIRGHIGPRPFTR
jgi:hypothetical protein